MAILLSTNAAQRFAAPPEGVEERGLQKVASTYHTLVPPGAWTEQLKAPAAGRAGGNCVGGAGILASRLIIQNHVMSLYNFMHWLTMMMMTMTMAMIMTTPTQPDGDRDRHGGTEHRQTDRQTDSQTVGQTERDLAQTEQTEQRHI